MRVRFWRRRSRAARPTPPAATPHETPAEKTELLWDELPTEEIPIYQPHPPSAPVLRVPPYLHRSGQDGTGAR